MGNVNFVKLNNNMNIQNTIIILVSLLILALINGFRITINPFKVTFSDWHLFVAWILFLTALIIYRTDIHSKAYKKGLEKGVDMMFDTIKREVERVKKEKQ